MYMDSEDMLRSINYVLSRHIAPVKNLCDPRINTIVIALGQDELLKKFLDSSYVDIEKLSRSVFRSGSISMMKILVNHPKWLHGNNILSFAMKFNSKYVEDLIDYYPLQNDEIISWAIEKVNTKVLIAALKNPLVNPNIGNNAALRIWTRYSVPPNWYMCPTKTECMNVTQILCMHPRINPCFTKFALFRNEQVLPECKKLLVDWAARKHLLMIYALGSLVEDLVQYIIRLYYAQRDH